jgi:hypothetical protein
MTSLTLLGGGNTAPIRFYKPANLFARPSLAAIAARGRRCPPTAHRGRGRSGGTAMNNPSVGRMNTDRAGSNLLWCPPVPGRLCAKLCASLCPQSAAVRHVG